MRRRLFSRRGPRLSVVAPVVPDPQADERGAAPPGGARQSGGDVPARPPLAPRDRQQAVVFEMLRRAAGAPVTYAELHDAGIEFPASVVAELELAGVAVERRQVGARGARPLTGVCLDPRRDRGPSSVGSIPEERPAPRRPRRDAATGARLGRRGPSARIIVRGGAAAAAVAVLAAALAALVPGRPHSHAAAPPRTAAHRAPARVHARGSSAVAVAGARTSPPQPARRPPARRTPAPATVPRVSPSSVALAVELDLRGHDLLQTGRYGAAIPVLRMAMTATGARPDGCQHPASTACLTYAYALYDLGRALRLSGQAAAAVPLLEARLQIDNQRPVVALELARAEAAGGVRTG